MVFCIHNCDVSTRIASLYGFQLSSVVLCIHNNGIMTRITSLYGSQTSHVILCMQNSVISTRITSLHESQTSPVVLCMQNNVISIRITSLHGSQLSSVAFAGKTTTFGSELQVSMGPRLRLLICECKTTCLDPEWCFVPAFICGFAHSKERLEHQTHKSLWIPALICGFCMQKSDFRPRITNPYGSKTSPVVFAFKTATSAPELQVSMGPSPHLWFLQAKLRLLDQNYKSLWVPDFACWFVNAKQRA